MVKKVGSFDKVAHRKRRSDIGKPRKKYRGQPCKHKKKSYYYKRRIGNKKDFWMWIWGRNPMSKDGYKNWKPHLRGKLWKEVTDMKSHKPQRVPFNLINTKTKMEEFVASQCGEGKWIVMGGSNAKNKGHHKNVPVCVIVVRESPNGNIGTMMRNIRLSKYFWYNR